VAVDRLDQTEPPERRRAPFAPRRIAVAAVVGESVAHVVKKEVGVGMELDAAQAFDLRPVARAEGGRMAAGASGLGKQRATALDLGRSRAALRGNRKHAAVVREASDLVRIDLRRAGHQVFVVAEAVSSRDPESKLLELERMRSHGIEIVNREMVGFEWLRRAGDARFREILRDFLR
jgi:hypothetical protein